MAVVARPPVRLSPLTRPLPPIVIAQRRIGVAIDPALRIRRHRDRTRRDGEIGRGISQRIVAAGSEIALGDGVAADAGRGGGAGGQTSRQAVAVDQTAASDRVAQRRIGVAVDPALRIGRHRERTRRDGEIGPV